MLPMPSAIVLWQRLHWSFFVNTQGLLMALRRFERALDTADLDAAREELQAAAALMRASGASMQLAGSFTQQEYEHHVRPSMMPPHVAVNDFSGLMSWDHSTLIQTWKRLSPKFGALPEALHEAHLDFVDAYRTLATSHAAVCSRFGGEESGSIRYNGKPALSMLERFQRSRQRLIDPTGRTTGGCPFEIVPLDATDTPAPEEV
jgi:hypothetical protein